MPRTISPAGPKVPAESADMRTDVEYCTGPAGRIPLSVDCPFSAPCTVSRPGDGCACSFD